MLTIDSPCRLERLVSFEVMGLKIEREGRTHAEKHVADAAERADLLTERVLGVRLLDGRVAARVLNRR